MVQTCFRTSRGNTDNFSIDIGSHQGSVLSPCLFTIVMNELAKRIQNEALWCMLFADDIILINESKNGINKLKQQRHTL